MTRRPTPQPADRQNHDPIADAGLALARPLSADRVVAELGQQLQRATRCESAAIALADGGDPDALTLAHHSGFGESPSALAERLAGQWRAAFASDTPLMERRGELAEVTAAIRSGTSPHGVLTVVVDAPATDAVANELTRVLSGIAAHAGAALERARAVVRLEQRRRVATVDEVTTGLAHELRNRLFGISSAAQLLRFRVNEDPAVEKNVGRILREVERMNSTVNALLEFGQPSSGSLVPGDPDRIWDEVLEQQRGLFESKALKLQRVRAEPARQCPIDAPQLASAFTNLLVNAADAAPEGTDLSLTAVAPPDGSWRCRLANGGPVIGPDALRRAFDLFFTTKEGGTGMGLPLCRRILDDHGGTLSLESSAESGTVATVSLPAAPRP
ncbi:MAG: hypothetical protein H0X64_04395 [Gemmatimonadaceae bacterium]|nr:hypothetical protein [Gemmatimonadaceae bacterium]